MYQSSDKFLNPTNQYGYGIPDFEQALYIYQTSLSLENFSLDNLKIYPNPAKTFFEFSFSVDNLIDYKLQVYNVLGKKNLEKYSFTSKKIDVSNLEAGIYLVKIQKENQQKIIKLIKQ